MLKEFKPTILFLVKFLAIYGIFSLLYGWYIQDYDTSSPPVTDPFTQWVTQGCSRTANVFGYQTAIIPDDHLNRETLPEQTYDTINLDGEYAISVEEGCNGINIMIIFVAFVVAFGGNIKKMLIFIPAGLVFIHLFNLLRLFLLSWLNVEWGAQAFHFFHKYGFTAFLYLAVLFLWFLWVMKFSGKIKPQKKKHAEAV